MRWAGQVTTHSRDKNACKFVIGKPEGKEHLGDQCIDERIQLKSVFRKLV
jgi:hypothetical protein